MNSQQIANRAYGTSSTLVVKRALVTRLVYALQPSSVSFSARLPSPREPNVRYPVNALTIDRFDGRYLLSGGADSSIALWDLEAQPTVADGDGGVIHAPLSTLKKTAEEHKLGITQVSFYPFDSLAFLTSSYDHTVKIYSSETLMPSASFNLGSVVYSIALSPIASHLLVACATQHPTVRLVDLRSGASAHSLAGHTGAILSTAWSPTREHILASGATDGSVRFWDVRRSMSELGTLDMEYSTGLSSSSLFTRNSVRSQAHRGPVNGLVWTENGHHLVTCGHDQRIRVWDTSTGANTLASFGPVVKNSDLASCVPLLPPAKHLQPGKDVLFYPNEHEILGYELFDGKLVRRLRRTEQQRRMHGIGGQGQRDVRDKITALAWRAHDVEMYSAHADGSISAWLPRTEEDAELDKDTHEEQKSKDESKKRKREVLDEIYQDLTRKTIAFG